MHVLVVQDNPREADDLRRLLEKLGHTAAPPVTSAGEALRAVAAARPDLVLMTARPLADNGGPATASLLREHYALPVVLLVPRADAERHAGAASFNLLATPVAEHELRAMLDVAAFKREMELRLRESEARLATTLRSIADAVITTDTAGRVTFANPAATRLTGVDAGAAVGMALADLLPLDDAQAESPLAEMVWRAVGMGESTALERPARLGGTDGAERHVSCSVAPVVADSGLITGAVIVLHDVTDQQRAAADQRRHTMEVTTLGQLGGDLLRCGSTEEAYAVIARAARRLFPDDDGALIIQRAGHPLLEPAVVWGGYPTPESHLTPEACWALREGRIATTGEPAPCCACGGVCYDSALRSLCVPLVAEGKSLGVLHIRVRPGHERPEEGARRDRLALALAEHAALGLANIRLRESLHEESIRDALTGLYNRRYLEATLLREQRRAARSHYPIGIIMLDIDHFKRVNDTYGHDAGDALLRALSICLMGTVRAEDVVCRYGGEEFVLMLPSASAATALARAEQICATVRALDVSHDGRPLGSVTASVGVTTLQYHEPGYADALARADRALYQAKHGGRNQAVLAPPPDDLV